MKPITTSFLTGKDTCTPISSDCVVWNGPDLPCVTEPCNGESATNVLQLMADKLCELSDQIANVVEVDFSCLLSQGDSTPTTNEELLQLIIDKLCDALDVDPGNPDGPKSLYPIPSCINVLDGDGNRITSAELSDWIDYVSEAFCDLISDHNSLQNQVNALQARVVILESATPTGTGVLPNITSKCATATNGLPNQSVPITAAIMNLETAFCNLYSQIGTSTEITNFIQEECTGLDNAPSLSNESVAMNELAGWTENPSTVMQNLNNMWLVICDMRAALIKCCVNPVIPCVPYSVTNVNIGTPTVNGATITWTAPSFGSSQAPESYTVGIYDVSGNQPTGSSLITEVVVNFPTTTATVVANTLVPGKPYAAVVTAYYEDCGESGQAFDIGPVLLSSNEYCLELGDVESSAQTTQTDCDGTLYFDIYRTVTLRYLINGIQSANMGSSVSATLKFNTRQNENPANPLNTPSYYTLTIPTGASSAVYTYKNKIKSYNAGLDRCEDVVVRQISCIYAVNATSPEGATIDVCESNSIKPCVLP